MKFLSLVAALGVALEGIAAAESVAFRLAATTNDGIAVDTISVGSEFQLQVWVQDTRADAHGVYSAFLDLLYPEPLVHVVPNSLTFGPDYGAIPSGDLATPGLLDEVGAFTRQALTQQLGGDERLLFSVQFMADHLGRADFSGNSADILPRHATTVHGLNDAVGTDEIQFGTVSVNIVPEPSTWYVAFAAGSYFMARRHSGVHRQRRCRS